MSEILIDGQLFKNEYVLAGDTCSTRMNAGLFTQLFINLRLRGWSGGSDLFEASFDPAGVKMKNLSGSYAISAGEAQELARLLRDIFCVSSASEEFRQALEPIVHIATRGAFVIHTSN